MMKNAAPSVDAYIAGFSPEVQTILEQVRATVRTAAPEAEETIAYAMPAYRLYGKPLVYFAAFKNHIGFYALPSGTSALGEEMSRYKSGKGSIQFPLSEAMPLDLIARIVAFRVEENAAKR